MRLIKTLILVIFLPLGSCVYLPKVAADQFDCKVRTKRLAIEESITGLKFFAAPKYCDDEACLAAVLPLMAVSAGTYVVSGSIVVIGNSLNWLELKSACPKMDWVFDPAADVKQSLADFWRTLMSA